MSWRGSSGRNADLAGSQLNLKGFRGQMRPAFNKHQAQQTEVAFLGGAVTEAPVDGVRNTDGPGTPIALDEPDTNENDAIEERNMAAPGVPPARDEPDIKGDEEVLDLINEDDDDIPVYVAMSDAEC